MLSAPKAARRVQTLAALVVFSGFCILGSHAHELESADDRKLLSSRKLFGVSLTDLQNHVESHTGQDLDGLSGKATTVAAQTGTFVQDTSSDIKDQATMSFDAVKNSFKKANELIKQAIAVGEDVYERTMNFGKEMLGVYTEFLPLEKIFASPYGMVPLVSSKENMRTLASVVDQLLTSADELMCISKTVETLCSTCDQLYDVLHEELSKLQGRRLLAGGEQPNLTVATGQLQGSRRLFVGGADYTSLLIPLDFQPMVDRFHGYRDTLNEVVGMLMAINTSIRPHLSQVTAYVSSRRLIQQHVDKAKDEQAEYKEVVTTIIPTWRKVEAATIDVCEQGHVSVAQIKSLDCRVKTFSEQRTLPHEDTIKDIVDKCDKETQETATNKGCPKKSHSEGVRDIIADNAGFIGWVCVAVQYMINYSTATRIFFAIAFFLIPGLVFAGFGFRFKDVEFWVEGFLAGFVMFSGIISVLIVWFGVCRGEFIASCDYKWTLVLVIVLSAFWAFVVVQGEKCEVFFGGFDLGCLMGFCIYFWFHYEKLMSLFLDPEAAKLEMGLLLGVSVLTGVAMGAFTLYFERPAIVFGTSMIGGAMIMGCFLTICPLMNFGHDPSWGDLVGWFLIAAVGCFFQYKFTNPFDEKLDVPKAPSTVKVNPASGKPLE